MNPKTSNSAGKKIIETASPAESLEPRLSRSLDKHSKILSIIIILAVAIPIVAVGAQVSPTERKLPAAPDFRMYDVETLQWIKMSDFVRKNDANQGKVVFVDFMATWCVTCKQAMPELRTLHALYASNPSFMMLSVTTSTADDDGLMKQFKQDYFANWTFAVPLFINEVGGLYGVNAYPSYVIVDRDGQIAYRSVGATSLSKLTSQIDRILNS